MKISLWSVTQKFVKLFIIEAEIAVGVILLHDMLYVPDVEFDRIQGRCVHTFEDRQLGGSRHCKQLGCWRLNTSHY